jgi:hypothetical protein
VNEEPEFDHTFTYVVGFIGVLCLVGWIVVVGEAIVSDRPITLKGVIVSVGGLVALVGGLTFFALYTYIECNLKGVTKALYGEPNLWSFDSDGFSVFYVKIFMMSVSEITIYASPKVQNLFLASRKFFKRDIPPDLILSFQRNTEKLAELKKHYPWLVRLHDLGLINGYLFLALIPFFVYLE